MAMKNDRIVRGSIRSSLSECPSNKTTADPRSITPMKIAAGIADGSFLLAENFNHLLRRFTAGMVKIELMV